MGPQRMGPEGRWLSYNPWCRMTASHLHLARPFPSLRSGRWVGGQKPLPEGKWWHKSRTLVWCFCSCCGPVSKRILGFLVCFFFLLLSGGQGKEAQTNENVYLQLIVQWTGAKTPCLPHSCRAKPWSMWFDYHHCRKAALSACCEREHFWEAQRVTGSWGTHGDSCLCPAPALPDFPTRNWIKDFFQERSKIPQAVGSMFCVFLMAPAFHNRHYLFKQAACLG